VVVHAVDRSNCVSTGAAGERLNGVGADIRVDAFWKVELQLQQLKSLAPHPRADAPTHS